MYISLISGLIGVLINTIICHILLTRRKSILYCVFLLTFLTVILTILTIYAAHSVYGGTPLVKYFVFMLTFCYIIYDNIVFEESLAKKLFTMLSVWLFSCIFVVVSVYILEVIMHRYQSVYSNYSIAVMRISLELFMRFMQLSLFISIRKTYRHYIRFIDDRTVYFISLYTFIGLLLFYENFRSNVSTNAHINIRNLLMFETFYILGYINVWNAIMSTKNTIMLNSDIKIIETQLILQRENYKSLIEFTEDRSKLKHDLRHHILVVKSMLETGNSYSALQYIRQFNQSELMKDIPVICMNLAADSLIKYYMSIAISKGIDFQTKLNIPVDININSIDLSVILGNCIENAINACDKLCNGESKYIELKSNIVGQNLIIKIKNSFNGIIKKEGDVFISSNHDGYGIGITSLMVAAEKYKGNVDIKYNDNEFEVNIILLV